MAMIDIRCLVLNVAYALINVWPVCVCVRACELILFSSFCDKIHKHPCHDIATSCGASNRAIILLLSPFFIS